MNKEKLIRYVLFALAGLAVIVIVALLLGNLGFVLQNLLLIVVLAIIVFALWKADAVLQLKDYERAVVMRFGKVNRVGGPGWAFIIPFIEDPTIVDLRIQTHDVPKQDVIIKDGLELIIDAVIYFKVKEDNDSVIRSVVEVEDYHKTIESFIVAKLRDVIGGMDLITVISNFSVINKKLSEEVHAFVSGWGLEVERVELQDVDLPPNVLQAMHEQKAAVQQKLAALERIEARRAEIDAVNKATETLSDKAILYYYIKALEEMSKGKSTKIIFPMEVSKLAESISNKISPSGNISTEMVEAWLKKQQIK